MRKLTAKELEEISDVAVSAAQNFIFARVPKKEIIDLDISVVLDYNHQLDVDVVVDILFDQLSSADSKIVDEAADHAVEEVEKFLS